MNNDLREGMRSWDRASLEAIASGTGVPAGLNSPSEVGDAKAELLRRDREYAETQEAARQEFETALADKQLRAATDVARATKLAVWAAVVSAAGALAQAALAALTYWHH